MINLVMAGNENFYHLSSPQIFPALGRLGLSENVFSTEMGPDENVKSGAGRKCIANQNKGPSENGLMLQIWG